MSEPFVGEIKMFAGNFAPRNYALCDGQLLTIAQNQALFSLFGTIYGGDGRTTFALPDLRGRVPIHKGQGPGLSSRPLGQRAGAETVAPSASQLPAHTHPLQATKTVGQQSSPAGAVLAQSSVDIYVADPPDPSLSALSVSAISNEGGSQAPHNNVAPFLCINFIVALFGIFPSGN